MYKRQEYTLHFKRGENVTDAPNGIIKVPYAGKKTGTVQRFKPCLLYTSEGAECVAKSYPGFFEDLEKIRI